MSEFIIREILISIGTFAAIVVWLWVWEHIDYYVLCDERRIARVTKDWSYFQQYRPWSLKEILLERFWPEWRLVIPFVVLLDIFIYTFSGGSLTSFVALIRSFF